MRRCGVQRSRGGAMASSIHDVYRFAVHTRAHGWHFHFFQPETRFKKSVFTGSTWTIGQNNANMRLHKGSETSPCLKLTFSCSFNGTFLSACTRGCCYHTEQLGLSRLSSQKHTVHTAGNIWWMSAQSRQSNVWKMSMKWPQNDSFPFISCVFLHLPPPAAVSSLHEAH